MTQAVALLVPTSMNEAIRLAEIMAQGKMMPEHLQKSSGDCLMVVEQAMRWKMSPFAVAQATSSIKGKLMFSGALVAAALHTSGALSTRLSYEYSGDGSGRVVVISATLAGEDAPRSLDVALKDARTTNAMWDKQPDQQLAYHGARVWARRFCPEVMLGVYSQEEFDAPPPKVDTFQGVTVESTIIEPPKRTARVFMDDTEARLMACHDAEAVDEIIAEPDTQRAMDAFVNGNKERLDAIIKAALDRTAQTGEVA
jgi:hypothetical protein